MAVRDRPPLSTVTDCVVAMPGAVVAAVSVRDSALEVAAGTDVELAGVALEAVGIVVGTARGECERADGGVLQAPSTVTTTTRRQGVRQRAAGVTDLRRS
jgi:hypothetical protein